MHVVVTGLFFSRFWLTHPSKTCISYNDFFYGILYFIRWLYTPYAVWESTSFTQISLSTTAKIFGIISPLSRLLQTKNLKLSTAMILTTNIVEIFIGNDGHPRKDFFDSSSSQNLYTKYNKING